MNLIQAIKSGKPFKCSYFARNDWYWWVNQDDVLVAGAYPEEEMEIDDVPPKHMGAKWKLRSNIVSKRLYVMRTQSPENPDHYFVSRAYYSDAEVQENPTDLCFVMKIPGTMIEEEIK